MKKFFIFFSIYISPALVITISLSGLLKSFETGEFSILEITSNPSRIFPKTTCFPFNHDVSLVFFLKILSVFFFVEIEKNRKETRL